MLKLFEHNEEFFTDVEVIICVAGGFSMEKISDPEVFDGLDKMITYNVKSAISASYVAAHCLTEGGLLVLTGAAAATCECFKKCQNIKIYIGDIASLSIFSDNFLLQLEHPL